MLSAEDAKPQSNNRTKSDLGHVGRRFVGAWVSGVYGILNYLANQSTQRNK